ncbi:hypothetical protein QBC36DRAFT_59671 [Triangularia setosa]|uniref:Uncharacterized protein n=1 Tax=Triangularia setosa TaxID=2587417 RepID=A0AAN6W2Y9_9PEZI|nr:hypothetical protein QBC36DRAFT_59671 [Podospora setosa]
MPNNNQIHVTLPLVISTLPLHIIPKPLPWHFIIHSRKVLMTRALTPTPQIFNLDPHSIASHDLILAWPTLAIWSAIMFVRVTGLGPFERQKLLTFPTDWAILQQDNPFLGPDSPER